MSISTPSRDPNPISTEGPTRYLRLASAPSAGFVKKPPALTPKEKVCALAKEAQARRSAKGTIPRRRVGREHNSGGRGSASVLRVLRKRSNAANLILPFETCALPHRKVKPEFTCIAVTLQWQFTACRARSMRQRVAPDID